MPRRPEESSRIHSVKPVTLLLVENVIADAGVLAATDVKIEPIRLVVVAVLSSKDDPKIRPAPIPAEGKVLLVVVDRWNKLKTSLMPEVRLSATLADSATPPKVAEFVAMVNAPGPPTFNPPPAFNEPLTFKYPPPRISPRTRASPASRE